MLRAKLSDGWVPQNPPLTNDQNIINADGVTPNLVPSEGYTYPRTPAQVRVPPPSTVTVSQLSDRRPVLGVQESASECEAVPEQQPDTLGPVQTGGRRQAASAEALRRR